MSGMEVCKARNQCSWPFNTKKNYLTVSPPLIFVTTPRFASGTPFTLGTITGSNAAGGPVIAPFPNFDWQSGDCSKTSFANVVRIAVSS